ncbi:hypothetical protein [Facklamia hominis]
MLSLLKQEYSIILRKKTTYILIAITIISAILLPILSFQTFEYTFVNNTGEKIKENGISAIIKANELQKPIAGKVDSELINESLNVYYKSLNSQDGKINWNEEFTIYKPINENLLYYLIEDFKERNIGKEETINSISNNFYDLRKDIQKKGFAEILNQNEQVYGEMLESKVDEPYTFEPHNGWDMYIMFLSYFFKISMVVSIIFISPLFTESKENNSMDIIYATKNGKMKYKIIRLFTSISFSCLLSILGVIIYLIAGRFVLNYNGLKTSVQLIQLFSPQPINIGRLLFNVISFGLIGVLSVSNITAYCSYKLQKGRNVGLIMIGSFIIYIILNGLVNIPGDLGKTLFDLIPFRASDIYFILLEGVSASKILITLGNEKVLLFMLLLYVVVANFKIIKCNQ